MREVIGECGGSVVFAVSVPPQGRKFHTSMEVAGACFYFARWYRSLTGDDYLTAETLADSVVIQDGRVNLMDSFVVNDTYAVSYLYITTDMLLAVLIDISTGEIVGECQIPQH